MIRGKVWQKIRVNLQASIQSRKMPKQHVVASKKYNGNPVQPSTSGTSTQHSSAQKQRQRAHPAQPDQRTQWRTINERLMGNPVEYKRELSTNKVFGHSKITGDLQEFNQIINSPNQGMTWRGKQN
ncbi:hypothetical protein OS493_012931 [Desmophyllum pertusum]|uniref:Uncharacterized protein n=1 Tax=Desmophyllum pertusum TaxID=174260 RepID=A0A9W9Z2W9_9CNID|nr:hypothetical protein OS493_012931 [Desmophyllum pertusum]